MMCGKINLFSIFQIFTLHLFTYLSNTLYHVRLATIPLQYWVVVVMMGIFIFPVFSGNASTISPGCLFDLPPDPLVVQDYVV